MAAALEAQAAARPYPLEMLAVPVVVLSLQAAFGFGGPQAETSRSGTNHNASAQVVKVLRSKIAGAENSGKTAGPTSSPCENMDALRKRNLKHMFFLNDILHFLPNGGFIHQFERYLKWRVS